MDTRRFWAEIRRKRNSQFAWWVAWPFLGAAIAMGYRSAFGVQAPSWLFVVLLFGWLGVALALFDRLAKVTCPRCGRPAIRHSLFFMRHAKCQHCGLSYADG